MNPAHNPVSIPFAALCSPGLTRLLFGPGEEVTQKRAVAALKKESERLSGPSLNLIGALEQGVALQELR